MLEILRVTVVIGALVRVHHYALHAVMVEFQGLQFVQLVVDSDEYRALVRFRQSSCSHWNRCSSTAVDALDPWFDLYAKVGVGGAT